MKDIIAIIKEQIKQHGPSILFFFIASALFVPHAFDPSFQIAGADTVSFNLLVNALEGMTPKDGNPSAFWLPNIFSGMPTLTMTGWLSAGTFLHDFYHYFEVIFHSRYELVAFFLSCVSFYIFGNALGLSRYSSFVAALAYSFTAYNPILVVVGHYTKFLAISYYPIVIASIFFMFRGKWEWACLLLLCFSFGVFSHQQITYYTILTGIIVLVFFAQQYLKEKQYLLFIKRFSILFFVALLGTISLLPSNLLLLDYNKQSLRGGGLEIIEKNGNEQAKTQQKQGLDIDYAFAWSYGKTETFTLIFPGVYGYGNNGMTFSENSATAKLLQSDFGYGQKDAVDVAKGFSSLMYWGDAPFVESPIYIGILVCLLALIGLVFTIRKNPYTQILFALTVISMMMAWGKHLMWFNEFLFNYLPLYNKFRVPSMILVITQLGLIGLAGIGLEYMIKHHKDFKWKSSSFKKLSIIMGSLLFAGLVLYSTLDFMNIDQLTLSKIRAYANEGRTMSSQELYADLNTNEVSKDYNNFLQILGMTKGNVKVAYSIFSALVEDRQSEVLKNTITVFWYFLFFMLLLLLLVYQKIKPLLFVVFIGGLVYADLFFMGKKYLLKELYTKKEEQATKHSLKKTPLDEKLLEDKDPNYRVHDLTLADPFGSNELTAFHKSIGGYNAAKLSIYNDLIRYQLSKNNLEVFNMLNTKYFIQQNTQGEKIIIPNPSANGNCWLVSDVIFVKNDQEEMLALDSLKTKTQAVVQEKFSHIISEEKPNISPNDYIRQTYFSFDTIRYEYECTTPQVAVFSEIYSPYWRVKDESGKNMEIAKVNYVLRGLVLKPGKHRLEFYCYPESFYFYKKVSVASYYINLLAVLSLISFMLFKFIKSLKKSKA